MLMPMGAESICTHSNYGRERRIKVFNKFSTTPLGKLLDANGLSSFMKDWKDLTEKMNQIVHGWYYVELPTPTFIRSTLNESLKTFSIVSNHVHTS